MTLFSKQACGCRESFLFCKGGTESAGGEFAQVLALHEKGRMNLVSAADSFSTSMWSMTVRVQCQVVFQTSHWPEWHVASQAYGLTCYPPKRGGSKAKLPSETSLS